jgi:sialic acid synthase SpsE
MTDIIIELGLNHLGDEARAARFLDAALNTEAQAITFQVREASFYTSPEPGRVRLSIEFYRMAARRIKAAGKKFGIALCDESLIPVYDELGVDFWKTLSWDLGNAPLQQALTRNGKPVFVSTGVSSMADIVRVISANPHALPIQTQLSRELPNVNVSAIRTIREHTGRPTAFGLHCAELDVILLALPLEPVALFFYVKEPDAPYFYDNEHAIPVEHLASYVSRIKNLSSAIGDGQKHATSKPGWLAT